MTDFHQSTVSDTQFGKTFFMLLSSMIVLTGCMIVLAYYTGGSDTENTATIKQEGFAADIAARTEPIGKLTVGAQKIAQTIIPEANAAVDGGSVYQSSCAACHASGVAGAPKVGVSDAWKERIAKGNDTLYSNAINGFQGTGFMPAKGGNASLSDDEVKAAVDHMVEASK